MIEDTESEPTSDKTETAEAENEAAEAEPVSIRFADFLASVPPSQRMHVNDAITAKSGTTNFEIQTPQLLLHCKSAICNGSRLFRFKDGDRIISAATKFRKLTFITYLCSNCRDSSKIFALHVERDTDDFFDVSAFCYKFGEYPQYGTPTPNRLLRLFGEDSKIFLKGRQCENHGLGIGAFGYYRRVVEGHKNQIFDEIIKVAQRNAPELVETFEEAKKEQQFLKAIESVKGAMPQALLVNGHNPLILLHSALSEGLHAQTDEQCLELAHDVRVVLADLVERVGQVLKDQAELNAAISRFMKPRNSS